MKNTIAYEHMKLWGPRTISLGENLPDMSHVQFQTVSFPKDTVKRFSDHYKLLLEFVMDYFGKKDVNTLDLIRYYNEKPYIKIYNLGPNQIRRLRDFYISKTGDMDLERLLEDQETK